MAQRIGLDIVLLAVTAIGLYQLQSYGTPLARDAPATSRSIRCWWRHRHSPWRPGACWSFRLVPRIGEIADRSSIGSAD
jgi:hypothetical protein